MLKKVGYSLLYWLAGMAAMTFALDLFLPLSPDPIAQHKIEHFLKNKDDYTILIVGSSISYHNVIPARLDEKLREHGIKSRSYNLALAGAGHLETEYLLNQIMLAKPKNLSLVLIDANHRFTSTGKESGWTVRDVYWQDLNSVSRSMFYWGREKSEEFFQRAARHTSAFFLRTLNWGRLAGVVFYKTPPLEKYYLEKLAANSGFYAVNWEPGVGYIEKYKQWAVAKNEHRELREGVPPPVDKGNKIDYTSLAGLVHRSLGAKLLVHRQPLFNRGALQFCQAPHCIDVAFEDRQKYAVLYEPSMFFDYGHYHSIGAGHFTEALAEKIAALSGERK